MKAVMGQHLKPDLHSDLQSGSNNKSMGIRFRKAGRLILRNWVMYLFLVPVLVYVAVFAYAPLYGIQIAFKDFVPSLGIWGSDWVGFKYFTQFFHSPQFWNYLKNTLILSIYGLIVGFPLPIALALILNDIKNSKCRRVAQTLSYMPHFISIVVLTGMLSAFFSPQSGFVNTIIKALGGQPIYFMGSPKWFAHMYVWSGVWQGMGWGSIIYLAALSGVAPELHESAMLDGASKLQRMRYIDLPSLYPTMAILLILQCGSIMSIGFDKVYLMQNSLNLSVSEVISTYTYKVGLLQKNFSYSAAIGLFNNVINFTILITVNRIVRKLSGSSLW